MTPKTPLPWTEIPCYFDNQCQAYEPKDAEFMLHTSNAYPALVQFIRNEMDLDKWRIGWGEKYDRYKAFLEGLGETCE